MREERCSAWLGNARGHEALWRAGRVYQEVLKWKMCTPMTYKMKTYENFIFPTALRETKGHDLTWWLVVIQ